MSEDINKKISIQSPSKIILTGEHFFIYTKKAILKSINNSLFIKGQGVNAREKVLHFNLTKFKIKKKISFKKILKKYNEIIQRYQKFLADNLPFKKILNKKEDFFLLVVGFFLQNYSESLNKSFKMKIFQKKNYIASKGLGSSASFVIGVIKFLNELFDINLQEKEIFEIAVLLENFKHGNTSGIDIICILKNEKNFICIEQGQTLNSMQNHKKDLILYLNFQETIKQNYNFFLDDFTITSIKSALPKRMFLYKSYSSKNKFSTFDIVQTVSKKKDYIIENISKIENIFFNFIKAIDCSVKINLNQRRKIFINSVEENNKLLFNLDIIPEEDMNFIRKMTEQGFFGKMTGSGGLKNINKSLGSIIFFAFKLAKLAKIKKCFKNNKNLYQV